MPWLSVGVGKKFKTDRHEEPLSNLLKLAALKLLGKVAIKIGVKTGSEAKMRSLRPRPPRLVLQF